jgi:hypothetical protein
MCRTRAHQGHLPPRSRGQWQRARDTADQRMSDVAVDRRSGCFFFFSLLLLAFRLLYVDTRTKEYRTRHHALCPRKFRCLARNDTSMPPERRCNRTRKRLSMEKV